MADLGCLGWPEFLKSNFHCLIKPYLGKLFSKSLMKLGDGLMTSKSERQRTSGPQKGQSLILFTVRDVTDRAHASSICPSVKILLQMRNKTFCSVCRTLLTDLKMKT